MWQQLMQLSGNIFTEFSQENLRVAVVFGLDADLELMPLLECHVPDFLGEKKKKEVGNDREEMKGDDLNTWMDE